MTTFLHASYLHEIHKRDCIDRFIIHNHHGHISLRKHAEAPSKPADLLALKFPNSAKMCEDVNGLEPHTLLGCSQLP